MTTQKVLVAASAGWLVVGVLIGGSLAGMEARAAEEQRRATAFDWAACDVVVPRLTDAPPMLEWSSAVRTPANTGWCVKGWSRPQ